MSRTDLRRELKDNGIANSKQWNSAIKAFLERGDTSMFKRKSTAEVPLVQIEVEDLGDVQVDFPMNKIPPYDQIVTEVAKSASGSWLLDEIAPAVFPQELPAIKPVVNPDTDKNDVATRLLSTIKPSEIIRVDFPNRQKYPYDFVDYRISGNPLLMLFGASIECHKMLDKLPDILYISKRLWPALERESTNFYGAYTGRFYLYHPTALAGIKKIPVFNESHLPEELRTLLEANYSIDLVIALVEH